MVIISTRAVEVSIQAVSPESCLKLVALTAARAVEEDAGALEAAAAEAGAELASLAGAALEGAALAGAALAAGAEDAV
jgi:hypothetical protein